MWVRPPNMVRIATTAMNFRSFRHIDGDGNVSLCGVLHPQAVSWTARARLWVGCERMLDRYEPRQPKPFTHYQFEAPVLVEPGRYPRATSSKVMTECLWVAHGPTDFFRPRSRFPANP